MNTSPLKILIVDDHRLFADGLALILSKLDGSPEIVTESNPRNLINRPNHLSNFDLIVVDLNMPTLNGFAFMKSLISRRILTPIVVVSSTNDVTEIESAFKHGAKGFIPKSAPTHEMLDGVSQVLSGKRYLPDYLSANIRWDSTHEANDVESTIEPSLPIRARQIEVLSLIHAGHANSEIASILNISESTVKGHIGAIFKALNVKNRTACVRVAIEKKLLDAH